MRIGFTCGYREEFWAGWPWTKMMGGSENLITQLAIQMGRKHEVTVRLPRDFPIHPIWRGVEWVPATHPPQQYDVLFSHDDFEPVDTAGRVILVAARSERPKHYNFDRVIFLSRTHLELLGGRPGDTWIGGGVDLADYSRGLRRIPRRVICSSSPDRCSSALLIGQPYDFVHSYKKIGGYPSVELDRKGLVALQQQARVLIYPLDPIRPSDFFSMAVLEALAAGTPVIVSDADSMPELWSKIAYAVLPRPIRISQWQEKVDELLDYPAIWREKSEDSREFAKQYSWEKVAQRYLEVANDNIPNLKATGPAGLSS